VDDVLLVVFFVELRVIQLPLKDGLISECAAEDSVCGDFDEVQGATVCRLALEETEGVVADGVCAGDRASHREETRVFHEVQVSARASEADEIVDHLEVVLFLFLECGVHEVLLVVTSRPLKLDEGCLRTRCTAASLWART